MHEIRKSEPMMDYLEIDGSKIPVDTNTKINLEVAKLPSGTQIDLPVYIFRSPQPGPTILLSGGLHGDEVNGIEIVRRMVHSGTFDNLLCGSVIALPIINIYGFINFSRDVPDGKDVNRSFPGYIDGSLASHVAYIISNSILPAVDFGIDFHTGGASRTNYPQIRFNQEDPQSGKLAQIFAAPFQVNTNYIDFSLRWQAHKMDKTIIVFEGGESLRLDELAVTEAINGVKRMLFHYQMIPDKPDETESIVLNRYSWIRAPKSGLFRALRKSGQKIRANEAVGIINNPSDPEEIIVESKEDGYLIGHNNMPVVHRGDALCNIGMI